MAFETPLNNPEKKEFLDDNARKFVLETNIAADLLTEATVISYTLTTDWIELGENNEQKIARKEFDNGDVQLLMIEKNTQDGSRAAIKKSLTDEEYQTLLAASKLRIVKTRSELTYSQNNIEFSVKYDEFMGSKLKVLEIEAASDEMRDSFNPGDFPSTLTEVTGDIRFYGYRVAEVL